jgi:uncharacterized membrane protein
MLLHLVRCMTMPAASWPKLIGVFVVAIGIAVSLKAAEFVSAIEAADRLDTVGAWPILVALVGSVGSIVVGLAVYSAQEGARRTLAVVTVVSILLCLVYAYWGVTRNISALGQLKPSFIYWWRLLFFGEALRAVSPPVFFLLVLLHPDVVRSFQPVIKPTI